MGEVQEVQTIGELIESRRTAAGLSKKKLATALGTSYQRIILWEQDKHAPSATYAGRLADVLGGEAEEYLPAAYEPQLLRSELAELAAMVARNAEGQEALAEAVEQLSQRVLDLEAPRTSERPARPERRSR